MLIASKFRITVATLVLSLCSFIALGQGGPGAGYRHPHDFKDFNLGFMIGLSYSSFNLKDIGNVEDDGLLLKHVTLKDGPGLTLGLITNYQLSNSLSLRIIPSISLERRDFDFVFEVNKKDSVAQRGISSAWGNIPVMLQYKTPYYRRYRVYVLAGFQYSLTPAGSSKVQDDPNLLKTKSHDYSLVAGVGINLYGERVKLSPEIRVNIGLRDIFVPEFTSHASAISSLSNQTVSLIINFE